MKILIVQDDAPLARFLKKGLESEHHAVELAPDGEGACRMVTEVDYDLVVLDLLPSSPDGFQILAWLHSNQPSLPILVVSACNSVQDRVKALDMGADDFLVKPFWFAEFSARVRAILRRGRRSPVSVLSLDDLEVDCIARTVKQAGQRIDLTPKEFALLEYLMFHAGQKVTRTMILNQVWNLSVETRTNVVDVYINYLRKKLERSSGRKLIHTVRGVGYEFRSERGAA